jgi:hypothetical protein
VAGLRVQIPEPFLDTAERVAAYLQSEPGAVSAALHDSLSVLPLYSDSEGNLRPEDLEGNEVDAQFASWEGTRMSVNRDGSVVVELSVEQLHGNERRMVKLGCNLGTAEDLRVMIQESEARVRLQVRGKPRMGM